MHISTPSALFLILGMASTACSSASTSFPADRDGPREVVASESATASAPRSYHVVMSDERGEYVTMDLDATSSRDPHAPVHAIIAAVGSRPALSLTLQYAPHDDEPRIAYALTRMDPDGRTSESERTAVGQALLADLGPVPGLPEHAAADGSAAVAAGARVEGAVAFVRGSETTIAEGRWRDGAYYAVRVTPR